VVTGVVKIKAKKLIGFALLIIILFTFTAFITCADRSFEITDYQAQVKILENGDIQVSEIFEYDFDGDFNGIIRDKQRTGDEQRTGDGSLFFSTVPSFRS
jgi:hypothetical protein